MFARYLFAALLLLAVSTPAFAQNENLQIFREVQREVLRYPHFTVFDSIHATVENGVVTLTGKVTMPYKRNDIAKRVGGVTGVSNVVNDIEVLPVSQFDDELRVGIARAIYGNPHFLGYGSMVNPPIHIIVDRGASRSGRRQQQCRTDAGALDRHVVQRLRGEERAEDGC